MLSVEMSPSVGEIAKALSSVQSELEVVKGSTNPHFRSKYADLAAVVEAALGGLNKAGIAVLQPTAIGPEGQPYVVTTLVHTSGEWIRGWYPIVAKDQSDPQKLGAGFTYARRYSLLAMICAAPEDDDDGNTAAAKAPAAAPARKEPTAAAAAMRGAPPAPAAAPAPPRPPRRPPAPAASESSSEGEVE